jgi:NAD(P)-dependent dehydrogenase (short-subunit alcohol dehydrogenase family)
MENAGVQETMIVTGGSQGIGAGLVKRSLSRGYNVVASSRNITQSAAFDASDKLALVDGNIGEAETAAKIAEAAKSTFGSIDALVNNAGIYFSKPFPDYTIEDLRALVSVNIEGFLFVSQLAIRQMLAQKTGGSIVNITTTMAGHPIAGINCAVPMITKGGLEAITRSLAMEYARDRRDTRGARKALGAGAGVGLEPAPDMRRRRRRAVEEQEAANRSCARVRRGDQRYAPRGRIQTDVIVQEINCAGHQRSQQEDPQQQVLDRDVDR